MRRAISLWPLAVIASCGSKKEAAPAKATPAPAGEVAAPAPPAAPAPVAVLDPATFVAVDLAGVPALANVVAVAPSGATVTPDPPDEFGDKQVHGAVITAGEFRLHLWESTIGGERTTLPLRATMLDPGMIYAEHVNDLTVLEYTFTSGATTQFGYLRAVEDPRRGLGDQLLCGVTAPLATKAALAPYRAACDRTHVK